MAFEPKRDDARGADPSGDEVLEADARVPAPMILAPLALLLIAQPVQEPVLRVPS